jgi:HTH-type transcriptional regulator/antitoxin HigA
MKSRTLTRILKKPEAFAPLLAIRTGREYDAAVKQLNELVDEIGDNPRDPRYRVVETLSVLIEAYDAEHHAMPAASGIEALKYLMDEHHLTQADLPEIGSQGVVSEVLRGKRQLNVRQIKKLAARFHVSPMAFLANPENLKLSSEGTRERTEMESAAIDNQVGVFLTLETVFPEESPSIELLSSLLRQLNKIETIVTCARLNLIVSDHLNEGHGTWSERHLRKQLLLVKEFFDPGLFPRIEGFIKQYPNCSIFFRGQLVDLLRWASLFGKHGEFDDDLVKNPTKREIFAKALLTVNSLWEKRVYQDQLRSDGDLTTRRLNLLPRFRRSISESAKGPDLTQAFVRGRALICDRLCALDTKFSESFRKSTGLSVDEYYSCLLLIVLRSLGIDAAPGGEPIFSLRLFNPQEAINAEMQAAFSRFMAVWSQSASELTASLWHGNIEPSESDFATFEHRVIRSKPIFRIRDDLAIVMDPVFLAEMVTVGPLFMTDDVKGALQRFGHVFEAYCSQILNQIYPEATGLVRRFRPNPKGFSRLGSEVELADGILDCGDRTVFIETKAVWIREDKIESSPSDYVAFLRSKYGAVVTGESGEQKKGVAQLANSVRELAQGNWKPAEKDLAICEHIVPLLMVYDSLIDAPLHPWFLAREFAMLLDPSNQNWDGRSIRIGRFLVSSLIVMTIDDLEALESSTENFGICELLRDYAGAFPDRLDSLHNYIVADRKYGDAIVYSERVRKSFSAEINSLSERLNIGAGKSSGS